jgi:hypothetical protein
MELLPSVVSSKVKKDSILKATQIMQLQERERLNSLKAKAS